MTSLAHHWKQQGVEKGMQIGEAKRTMEVAKNMLNAGSDIPFISKQDFLSLSSTSFLKLNTNL